jgi:hypothetical protein
VRMHPDQMVPVNGSRTLPTGTVGASHELRTIGARFRRQARVVDALSEAVTPLCCVVRELGGENADLRLENERMRNRRVPSAGRGVEGMNR